MPGAHGVGEIAEELAKLDANYKVASAELNDLQEKAAVMEKRLNAASKLITGLTGERTRWTADIKNLNEQKVKLIGDCVLTASFLSYTGAFTREFRHELIFKGCVGDLLERKVPLTTPFNLENMLTTDAIKQGWTAKGLPADEHSIQNGMLTTKASRFPLCIDPQQQAVSWIKNTYGKDLKIKTLAESDFMKHLELAVQFGNPFLFENVDEELDPMLDPARARRRLACSGLRARSAHTFRMPPTSRLYFR